MKRKKYFDRKDIFSIYIDKELNKRLEKYLEKSNDILGKKISRNKLIEKLIENFLNENEKFCLV